MWGALPLRSHWGFQSPNSRWALGSHDICFSNRSVVPILFIVETVINFDNYGTCRVLSAFFTLGQVLPTHRLGQDRKSTRLNSSHTVISYAVFCLKKKNKLY